MYCSRLAWRLRCPRLREDDLSEATLFSLGDALGGADGDDDFAVARNLPTLLTFGMGALYCSCGRVRVNDVWCQKMFGSESVS